jgi:signal transduction histidine kinase
VSSSVTDFAGADRLVTVIAYDLTLVTRLEESLRQTEIPATLGAIAGGVAHEVRNPLFTISATLDAWEARLGETPHLRRYIVPLREEVDRLNRLMSDLLEYGKPHPLAVYPSPIAVPIAAAVADCRVSASGRGVTIAMSIEDGLPDPPIDSARMEQVFQNVIANAVQHSPEGGVVRVEAKAAGSVVTCTVVDEGRGLQPDDVERVFAPFYSRRKGGTGLGLSISRKIVLAHHGEITIGNRTDGPGAVVTIAIPSTAHTAAETGDHEDSDDVGRRRREAADGAP